MNPATRAVSFPQIMNIKVRRCLGSTIYNMSGRVVSDIQAWAEGERLYIRYNTAAKRSYSLRKSNEKFMYIWRILYHIYNLMALISFFFFRELLMILHKYIHFETELRPVAKNVTCNLLYISRPKLALTSWATETVAMSLGTSSSWHRVVLYQSPWSTIRTRLGNWSLVHNKAGNWSRDFGISRRTL